jgi:hypothetical protein
MRVSEFAGVLNISHLPARGYKFFVSATLPTARDASH